MERLQAAIEKAREQRDGNVPTAAAAAPGPAATATPEPATPEPAAADLVDAAWIALPEIRLRPDLLMRNRIVTLKSGAAAAPYDILRTRLIQQAQANNWRRIAVVSPHSNCGKSTTVANLAFGLARQSALRTVALDFDLRRNGLGRILGQSGHVPMEKLLEGEVPFADIARRHGTNLAFALGFGASRRSAELLQSRRTEAVLQAIEADYAPDLMIFDLPPMAASDDNFGFLGRVDAALILAEAENTTLTQIDVTERQVADLTNVLGITLNKCRYTQGAYGYEDGYY
ncbi:CpsD/CapB family tyrosine-protein kinase [Pseudoruegeria sp. HB172150]|uniref:CpsD/CapB family tyrosine-protein kinase n=1 Tax=Pseudoruegeria sp. HB172150 TaxID=2721164 RepID=UPI001557D793|nr:CpsD/CapB family tyrosine-protein kinase [Pseudoruegeria sp. HB172150]